MFEPKKNAKELGIDTTKKFRVVGGGGFHLQIGTIVELLKDDNSDCPYFRVIKNTKQMIFGTNTHLYWKWLEYYQEEKTLENLEVGEFVDAGDGDKKKVLAKSGLVFCLSEYDDFDSVDDWWTVQEMEERGFKPFIEEKTEILEVNIDQIAEKFGKKPEEIKIKK